MHSARVWRAARVVGFTVLLVAAIVLGRATRPEGTQISMAWPAAGVVVWWLLGARSRRDTVTAVALVALTTSLTNLATGAPGDVAVGFGLSNAAHAVVAVTALRRWLPGTVAVRTPGDVGRVLSASVLASLVSAGLAALLAASVLDSDPWQTFGLVLVRNAGSTFVLVSAVLALRGTTPEDRRQPVGELLLAGVASVALFAGLFTLSAGMPLLFLGILVPVWFGTRLGVAATASTGTVLSVFTVGATLLGQGPLADVADVQVRSAVVQAFIVVLAVVGLSLATLQRTGAEMRQRLHDSRHELQVASDAAFIGKAVVVRDEQGAWTVTRPNPALVRLLGRDPSAVRWDELLVREDVPVVQAALDRVVDGQVEAWDGEARHVGPHGEAVWTELHVSRLPTSTGTTAVVAQLFDITDRRAAQQELSRLALHDSLTGLRNRGGLHAKLEEMLLDARDDSRVVVVFLDLDGFKAVNDGYGHDAGDAVLQSVASALLAALRPGDVVGRLGGDEFVACCPGLAGSEEAETLVGRITSALGPALLLHGCDVGLGVSTGWTLSSHGENSTTLLRRSDEAMYIAKRAGKGQVAVDPTVYARRRTDRVPEQRIPPPAPTSAGRGPRS